MSSCVKRPLKVNTGQPKLLGYQLLEEKEDYYDVALYLARIHGWEAGYDSAYLLIDELILKEPALFEAYQTCVDVAYWENNLPRLDSCAEKALELEPESEEILEKYNLAHAPGAGEKQSEYPEVFVHYTFDHFSVPYVRNWHLLTLGAQIPVKWATLIPYINGGYESAGGNTPSTDIQFNLDAYLTLGKKNYALAGLWIFTQWCYQLPSQSQGSCRDMADPAQGFWRIGRTTLFLLGSAFYISNLLG